MADDLINTLERPGEFDALTTLRPREPYFLLVGRDRLAPPLIDQWADKNRRRALVEYDEGQITKERRDRELRKSTQAEMIAASMVEYKAGWDAQHPTEQKSASYSGHELPEHIKRRDAIWAARARASSALHNAIAEVNDLREMLGPDDGDEAALVVACDQALADIREADEIIALKRANARRPAPLLEVVSNEGESDGDEAKPES